MKRIVYRRPDGGVSVVGPSPRFMAKFKTEGEGMAALQGKSVPPDATDICICDEADISPDRTFRNAWERDTSPSPAPIKTDMPKARNIHMDRIRKARNAKLKQLDGPWMRAMGQGNAAEATRIEAQRQSLRDMPQTFDLTTAATPDELKALWPPELI